MSEVLQMSDRRRKALEELQLRLLAVTEDPTFSQYQGKKINKIFYAEIDSESAAEEPLISKAPGTKSLH
jgi:hypothetical protein